MSNGNNKYKNTPCRVSRRNFVRGIAVGGAWAALNSHGVRVLAEKPIQMPAVLTGNHYDLTIEPVAVNFTGRGRFATGINGSVPGPTMRWREGELVTVAVTNRLKVPTSLHWHGVRVPPEMDGVPGLSFPGVQPGETFVYRIPVRQSGTYWYHSHSGAQEQTGMSGAIIIEPKDAEAIKYDREYVIFLTDWTNENPHTILSNLKQDGEYYNYHQRTAGTFLADVRSKGFQETIANRRMWGRMNMTPTDISDVTGSTYTYLVNGNTPSANWTGLFDAGQRVRLRFINASAMTFFDVQIPGLSMTVVQADGNNIEPVVVDEFRIGNAETYDVIVEPDDKSAYTIFAQAFDRTGYARGTLASSAGITADVPAMDPRPARTMVDMGMAMGAMKGMRMPSGNSSSTAATSSQQSMTGMDMSASSRSPMPATANYKPKESRSSEAAESHSAGGSEIVDHFLSEMIMENRAGTLPLPQPGSHTTRLHAGPSSLGLVQTRHKKLHVGPQIDNLSMAIAKRLDDPGDGLKENGRRVLTYADLRSLYPGVDGRAPTREIELHLTGNMERYIWGFDGESFPYAEAIHLTLGERVRFILINESMMDHPVHLHGLWSELESEHGECNPYKHTIIVKPSERVSFLVSADTAGRWAFHCHLMYHMQSGMFRTVVVS